MSTRSDLETLRRRIAAIVGEDESAITDDEPLMDLGLDSVRAMVLIAEWRKAGLQLETSRFLELPTLAGWAALLREAEQRAS